MNQTIGTKRIRYSQIILGTSLMLAAAPGWSADEVTYDQDSRDDQAQLYRSHELSLDLFGSASLEQETLDNLTGEGIENDTELGVGLGLSYFFTRNLGVGAEAYAENTTGSFVDSTSASLILRLPLGQSGFAPYAFGGGGYRFDLGELWFAQFGAGIEYRFIRQLGVFLDARWVLPEVIDDYGVARLGLRYAF